MIKFITPDGVEIGLSEKQETVLHHALQEQLARGPDEPELIDVTAREYRQTLGALLSSMTAARMAGRRRRQRESV